jgi:hypothetical protein
VIQSAEIPQNSGDIGHQSPQLITAIVVGFLKAGTMEGRGKERFVGH